MKLTTKGRYAVTAILDLALHSKSGPVCLADISERQCISISYLEQLFAKLRKGGIVVSVRGPGGGYRLSRDGASIFISQVIDAVDENVDATRCKGLEDCQKGEACLTHHLWQELSGQIRDFLGTISVASLLAEKHVQKVAQRQDEYLKAQQNFALAQKDSAMIDIAQLQ